MRAPHALLAVIMALAHPILAHNTKSPQHCQELMNAAKNGDAAAVKDLLAAGDDRADCRDDSVRECIQR